MGRRVEFPSNAHSCQGYLAAPSSGRGAAVVVIQEWWGLVPHIEDVTDRFAREGFLALAPDLYHGEVARSPDEAGRLLMELDVDRAERDIAGAAAFLLAQPECSSKTFGIVGFCMGGALAQYAASKNEKAAAAVSFYGGFKKVSVDWENLHAALLLIYGETDPGVPPEQGYEIEKSLKRMGKEVEVVVYPGAGHAFFNDTRAAVYNADAAGDSWRRTVEHFRQHVF